MASAKTSTARHDVPHSSLSTLPVLRFLPSLLPKFNRCHVSLLMDCDNLMIICNCFNPKQTNKQTNKQNYKRHKKQVSCPQSLERGTMKIPRHKLG